MAQYAKLEVSERKQIGTQGAKELRREGKIPANFYYHGEDNINLTLDKIVFYKAIHTGHHIFEVELDGNTLYVMLKDVQYHPVTDDIIHVDLMRVRRSEKINISVSLALEGIPIGVSEGGVLTQSLTTIEINCLPLEVPEQIIIDVSNVEMNGVLTVSDIKVDEEIELVTASDMTVLSVVPPKEEILEPQIDEEEELAEGEEPAEEAADEPAEEAEAKPEPKEESDK